jgi:electron transfer flavoprotein alpha subunit
MTSINHTVVVLLDTPDIELSSSALELLTIGRSLGRVEAVSLGAPSLEVLAQLGAYGVGLVRQAELPADLGPHAASSTALVGEVLGRAADASGAGVVLLTSSFPNKEAAARLAWLAGAGLVIDAAAVGRSDEGRIVADKRVFAGAWDTSCEVLTDTAVLTVRANAVVAEPASDAVATVVEGFSVEPSAAARAGVPVEREVHAVESDGPTRPALAEAAYVVAGGRGTFGDFEQVEDLADALGAAVGATRDAVDEGWIGHDAQIGQTGVTIAPRVYVAAGISGAAHHRGGMQASQVVIAVNNDPDCPIFEISDFAVVGELQDVLPQAAARIREHRASAG